MTHCHEKWDNEEEFREKYTQKNYWEISTSESSWKFAKLNSYLPFCNDWDIILPAPQIKSYLYCDIFTGLPKSNPMFSLYKP